MVMKKVRKFPVSIHADGKLILCPDACEGNADWLATSRLSEDEIEAKFKIPLFEYIEEEEK
jgi:hypothetical protein